MNERHLPRKIFTFIICDGYGDGGGDGDNDGGLNKNLKLVVVKINDIPIHIHEVHKTFFNGSHSTVSKRKKLNSQMRLSYIQLHGIFAEMQKSLFVLLEFFLQT